MPVRTRVYTAYLRSGSQLGLQFADAGLGAQQGDEQAQRDETQEDCAEGIIGHGDHDTTIVASRGRARRFLA